MKSNLLCLGAGTKDSQEVSHLQRRTSEVQSAEVWEEEVDACEMGEDGAAVDIGVSCEALEANVELSQATKW